MKETTQIDYQARIQNVLQYIQEHLDEALPLNELAGVACFSPYHFHRVFQGMVGESLAEHIRRLRLERAARKLTYKRYTVTELAFDAGYDNVESFTRAFRSRFGTSPSQYRSKQMKAPAFKPPVTKGAPHMDVQIKRYPPIRVAYVRHIGPYATCHTAWAKLCSWAGPKGLLAAGTQYIGLCFDDPAVTPPEKIRYDACVTIPDTLKPDAGIGTQDVPSGDYAVALHIGPHEKEHETYAAMCRWIASTGREIKHAPSVEIYLNDPDVTPPDQLRIEIRIPLEDK